MIVHPWHFRAARAALGLRQKEVSDMLTEHLGRAFHVTSVGKVEDDGTGEDAKGPNVSLETYKAVVELYEALGIEFMPDGIRKVQPVRR